MTDPEDVNPQIVNAIKRAQLATMDPQVIKSSGAGKAYQSVAQSTAIAVQDAADTLRNMSLLSSTATGVAMSQLLATGNLTPYMEVISQAQTLMTNAIQNFQNIGSSAAQILREFPSG